MTNRDSTKSKNYENYHKKISEINYSHVDEKSLNLVIKFEQRKNQTIKRDRTYKYQFEKYKVCLFGDDCLPSFAAFSMDQVPMSTLNSGTILSARRPCNTFPLLSPHTASTYAASSLRSNRAQRANY